MKIKRAIYLGYYIKQLDRQKFNLFLNFAIKRTGKARLAILSDLFQSVFRYNISILEYFQFRFFELNVEQRYKWAGTGYMYEFQRRMNPLGAREALENKPHFMKEYALFIRHKHATVEELNESEKAVEALLENTSGKVVLKRSDGGCGKGIQVIETQGLTKERLLEKLAESGNNMVEEFVVQHNELMRLSPSGLNTVRIMTQVTENKEVSIVGCRLRISVDSQVDNMAAGNIAASVDSETGMVNSYAVYSDISKQPLERHPITGVTIKGFKLPYWKKAIEMVRKAALINTSNRSIGWDVAITNNGPELIEGNHDWCKLLWQLPEGKGLKHLLDPF